MNASPRLLAAAASERTEAQVRDLLHPAIICCPFCGIDPPLATSGRFGGFVIACDNDDCPAQPQVTGKTIKEAWLRWNGRRVS